MTMAPISGDLKAVAEAMDLGLPGRREDHLVVVAMSGGVDSSVTAALLHHAGYRVVGITLQLYDFGAALAKKGACCAGQDIQDARAVADRLGIAHYVFDYESRFREEVIEDFADTYLAGATPIPCVRCNQTVKFRDLLASARELNASCLATGHYIRRVEGPGGPELHRAQDEHRDQSYFLFATTREQLAFLRFPLGDLPKPQVRALADELGLVVADKPDSQDICFVPRGKYTDVIAKVRPGVGRGGDIVHVDGRIIGQHEGIIHYTVGQRRGLGVATGEPLFVVRLDAPNRQVIVGPREALGIARIGLKEVNWLGDAPIEACDGLGIRVKVRSTRPPLPGRLVVSADGLHIALATHEEGVAPGQAAVFFDAEAGSRVLGGGWIKSTQGAQAVSSSEPWAGDDFGVEPLNL
jgi:tRNA-uridine 2-sulfurtransferase